MESCSDARRVKQLIYGGEILSEEEYDSMLEKIDDFPRDVQHGCTKPSLYLQLFEDMINTVYEHESHLLSQNEWDVFATLKYYCYNARYCLIRLVLRKPYQWHTLSSLDGYKKEVGEVGLIRAITDLCRPWHEVMIGTREELAALGVQDEVQQAVGLVSDSMSQNNNAEAGPSNASTRSSSTLSDNDFSPVDQSFQEDLSEVQLDSFCYDESTMDITELLNRLSVKQLKELVKETKSRPSKSTKLEMIRALLNNASTQSVLQLPPSPMNERLRRASQPCLRQATLAEVKPSIKGKEKAVLRNQEQRLVQMVLKILGKCVRVNGDFYRLSRRLHIICFRCTEQPTSLLLPALLTSFKKRTYPLYEYKRDKSIWPTREDLLAYEEALELELYLEEVATKLPEKDRVPRTPAPHGGSAAPATPIGKILRTHKTPLKTPKDPPLSGCDVKEEAERQVGDVSVSLEVIDVEEGDASIQKAKRVKELLYEKIYPRWKESIEAKSREGCSNRKPGLERFEPGYIYTRMLHHALRSLATLKAYQAEYEILQALLGQQFYRRGSRAKWYERRAIIEMTYLSKVDGGKPDQDVLRQAMNGVKEALLDEDTGIVWRPGLFRRLQRLEKMLHIPEEERTPCEWELKQPQNVFIKAVRAIKRSNSMPLEGNGKSANAKNEEVDGLHAYFTPKKNAAGVKMEAPKEEVKENVQEKTKVPSWKGKSLWIGHNNEEVHVEIRALQYYESLGFKGFHAETRILTTVFSLLFWDIIFTDIPGAFETPYQTAPLDLAEDTFYYARKDLIEARLEEIRNGGAEQILELRDAEHREKQTLCVGLRWDICERSDLVQIVECLGGHTLALICQLFCEDYAGRSSGVPDLVVWCAERGICKFVEVKGPGDRPQENQKLWFDSLLKAKANVEICHVIDMNAPPKEKSKTPSTRKRKVALPVQPDLGCDDDDDDRRGYDGEASIAPDHYTPSDLGASALKKRRRGKKLAEDELPSFFASDADDGMT